MALYALGTCRYVVDISKPDGRVRELEIFLASSGSVYCSDIDPVRVAVKIAAGYSLCHCARKVDVKAGESEKETNLFRYTEAAAVPGTTGPGWMIAAQRVVRFLNRGTFDSALDLGFRLPQKLPALLAALDDNLLEPAPSVLGLP